MSSALWYPLSLYCHPPLHGGTDLANFELLAAKRLAVLQLIERKFPDFSSLLTALNSDRQHANNPQPQAGQPVALREVEALLLSHQLAASPSEQTSKGQVGTADSQSHFILKLAYSQDKDRQDWLVRQECKLMQIKLFSLKRRFASSMMPSGSVSALQQFMRENNMNFAEMESPYAKGKSMYGGTADPDVLVWMNATEFRLDPRSGVTVGPMYLYKVPFYPDGSSLVRSRRAYVHGGIVYVWPEDIDSVIMSRFRRHLLDAFAVLETKQAAVQEVFEDGRVGQFLKALPRAYIGEEFSRQMSEKDEDRLTPAIINKVYVRSFPPCMRRLYAQYLHDHHLRHGGRQQLWLFFKGAGMTMEENLQTNRQMWQDPSKFDKEHKYNIRHLYGQEGKRVNYPPLACNSIISPPQVPGPQDFHGCPFRHFDEDPLKRLMYSYGLSSRGVHAVMDMTKSRQPQMACVEYFKHTHPGATADGVGNHPNMYFRESRGYCRKQQEGATVTPETTAMGGREESKGKEEDQKMEEVATKKEQT
eukprot:GHVS01097731.1.p1 GENE.GHVS01097731.1~~GHVS01097731.1.p1  ORF type:complete len:585 (-),score=88.98 GHVS01097731.1:144-1736(-)